MKSLATALSVLVLLALPPCSAQADEPPVPDRAPASDQIPIPDPPKLAAKGYLLVEHNSGAILAESNVDERREPASLTKIMSTYVVFRELASGNLALTDEVLISEKAWRTGGSKMFIEVGDRVTVEDLLKGMIVQSGNDASVALAEHIAGSESTFAELMNTHAERLGMTQSHFMNADGLPHDEHYTTARDIALVTAATIREFPEYYAWYAEEEFVYNGIKQPNRNLLLYRDESVDGVKTGYTAAAGYCLVASAERDDMRLTSVVMGSSGTEARTRSSLALLNYGFRFFETHKLYPGDEAVETLRIWMGEIADLPVGPAEDVYVTIPRRQYDKLSAQLEKNPDIRAPVAKGDAVGHISISLEGEEVRRVPLVALQDVAEGGLLQKARDSVLQWF
ncbi:MAG: D-alanyl-D-alanine carboxypeptidase family protein [Pseudomonadota bacterium]|nr:D-alanyl-D-alanine carboxypeptidase family protein [Pseudomonadota bacterium]